MTDAPPTLVIKLGALGDFVYAIGPMQAIRRHHPDRHLVLLTRPGYESLGEATGLFDEIWADAAPKAWNIGRLLGLRRRLRSAGFERVYDLQTSDRSALYHRLFLPGPAPDWSGVVRGTAFEHRYTKPHRMHTVERQRAQLAIAGIDDVPLADLGFMAERSETERFNLPEATALLVPGSSPSRAALKRWPAERYGQIAQWLAAQGLTPVLIGGPDDRDAVATIRAQCTEAVDLTGETSLFDIAALARSCRVAMGNDTGPIHVIALSGAPTLGLYGRALPPEKLVPKGPRVETLIGDSIADIETAAVAEALSGLLAEPGPSRP